MCVVVAIENLVRCPRCGKQIAARDIHKPLKCPRCGALMILQPPDFKPFVILEAVDMVGGGEGGA